MENRESKLQALLQLTGPLAELSGCSMGGLDCPEPLATLTSAHITSVLKRYLAGTLSASQVEHWANAIEGREDVGYLPSSNIGSALHQLANPSLTEPLTPQSAKALVAGLSGVAT